MSRPTIAVIIPAYNEALSIGKVVKEIPKAWVDEVIVVSNNSSDDTEEQARIAGATVLTESRQGYGWACLKGMAYVDQQPNPAEIIVFLDADHSDFPEELPQVVSPLLENSMDLVIGSRVFGNREKGALQIHQRFGNWLATKMIRLLYGAHFTDLGPFRAIWRNKLAQLDMQDKTYGWTVEMQVKAAKKQYHCVEVPVRYRKRIGKSKVTGTIRGTFGAGYKIIYTILKYR